MNKIIWIINHYAITPDNPGGTRHYEIAHRLSKLGFNVVILASSVLHQNPCKSILHSGLKYKITDINKNFKFIWLNTITYQNNTFRRVLNMLSFMWNVFVCYKDLINNENIPKPNFVVGSTVHPLTPLISKKIAAKFNAEYIFEIRDLWPQSFIDMGLWKDNSLISKFFLFIEKQSIKGAKSIICLSPLTQDYLVEKYYLERSKIFYIPNGASDLSDDSSLNSELKFGNKKKFNVIFTGAIITSNRINIICESANLLSNNSDIQFIIVGDGNEKKSLLEKYNYLKNIQWLDPVPKNEIQNVLNEADLLLLIQGKVAWGSSNKLYDYLSVGKPIVSSVWVSHNDIVNKINAGISIAAEDPIELSEAILKIYNLPENEKKLMGNNAKEYVKKYHSWDMLAQKFSDAISN